MQISYYKRLQIIPLFAFFESLEEYPFMSVCDAGVFAAELKTVVSNLIYCSANTLIGNEPLDIYET